MKLEKGIPPKEPIIQFVLVTILSPICVSLEWHLLRLYPLPSPLHCHDTAYWGLLVLAEESSQSTPRFWSLGTVLFQSCFITYTHEPLILFQGLIYWYLLQAFNMIFSLDWQWSFFNDSPWKTTAKLHALNSFIGNFQHPRSTPLGRSQ